MKEQKHIEAMITAILIMVVGVLLTLFVVKCVQMKKEEQERDRVQSETETDAVEQTVEETDPEETDPADDVPEETVEETEQVVNGPDETIAESTVLETEAPAEPVVIRGVVLDSVIADYLRQRLAEYGIEWWLPYAAAQMFQESGFQTLAENRNGLDKGILQYRITYWPAMCREHGLNETTIFDWRAQIRIYVQDTARRLGSGCSIEETISRHKQSDYGYYDAEYVRLVLQWTN